MEMKALDSDNEFGDNGDFNSNELNIEREEDDFDDEHDGEEEEEESENEEEDGEEVGEEENETSFYSLKKLHAKKRKIVDRRASNSRKIRYNVYEKIVNSMGPETMVISPMLPDLNNLIGLKKQKPASVV